MSNQNLIYDNVYNIKANSASLNKRKEGSEPTPADNTLWINESNQNHLYRGNIDIEAADELVRDLTDIGDLITHDGVKPVVIKAPSQRHFVMNSNDRGIEFHGLLEGTELSVNSYPIDRPPATRFTAVGVGAGHDTSDADNTFIGCAAGTGLAEGHSNTMVGSRAGSIGGGSPGGKNANVSIGAFTGDFSGSNNVRIGYNAGVDPSGSVVMSGDNNIYIGYQANAGINSESNRIIIGNSAAEQCKIRGIRGKDPGTQPWVVRINDQDTLSAQATPPAMVDRKEALNITKIDTSPLHLLEPLEFDWSVTGERRQGFIKQDCADLLCGSPEDHEHGILVPMCVAEIQRLHKQVTEMEKKMTKLTALLERFLSMPEEPSDKVQLGRV